MSKIHIIDVDLGESIDDIISSSIDTISTTTLATIEQASEARRVVDSARGNKNKVTPEDIATQNAIDLMLNAVDGVLPAVTSEQLITATSPVIDNMTSLVLRLKSMLRKRGNKYRLEKTSLGRKPAYKLAPFNSDLPDSPATPQ